MPAAACFPAGTPLHAFFAWNEARRVRDRRHVIACDLLDLWARLGGDEEAQAACVAHLAGRPAVLGRLGGFRLFSAAALRRTRGPPEPADSRAAVAARGLVAALVASLGSADRNRHAAVFEGFEALAAEIDLSGLARVRPRVRPAPPRPPRRSILVVKLGALGDFVQALGPLAAIRRHHDGDRLTLLTTRPYADFAAQSGLVDAVLIDGRPGGGDPGGWLALARRLRQGRFERVYDLQTSDRSNAYSWLLRPGRRPEWSGIAWRCSHPHANPDRDRQHTLDRQAEQLLMAGVHPVSATGWLPPCRGTGQAPVGEAPRIEGIRPPFALLIAGSSPRHPMKRWPAVRYGELAEALCALGLIPVVIGVQGEEAIARVIRSLCPAARDLVGHTDLSGLAALARAAAVTVGNDTGATHLAAAAGNPVVVLFSRASRPELCAPRGARVEVLSRSDLADLGVADVLAAVRAALAAGTALPA